MIDKGVCDKGFIWNPSNCECECNISHSTGEYLDHKNCKCRKKLADRLIDECTEIVEEIKLAEIAPFENKNNSCKVYITLMIVVFAIFIGIIVYLICYYSRSLINDNIYCIKFINCKKK